SGNGLQTLAVIPTRKLGSIASIVCDVDGDGSEDAFVSEENASDYCLISPRTRKVLGHGTLDPALGSAIHAWDACSTGLSPSGEASVAVIYQTADAPRSQRIAVVSALTGLQLEPAVDILSRGRGLTCGRIPGGDRRWLAWSGSDNRDSGPVHLFVREVGVPDSTVEVLLPIDVRRYAGAICAVPVSGPTHDCLAITVSPASPSYGVPVTFDPIMFLDVARCFEKR
ncbi:MAG: hypothetical protein ABI054_05685, partial [Planctomycetota bacterium]